MRFALLAAAVAAIGCASTQRPSGPTVETVELEGVESVEEDTLADGLASHEPQGFFSVERYEYDPLAVDADIKRIEAYYARQGYYSAEVLEVDVERLEAEEGRAARVDLTFQIEEGPRTVIESFEVTGLPDDVEQPATKLEVDEPFLYDRYDLFKQELRAALANRGYVEADIDANVVVDREEQTARIEVAVEPGRQLRFGAEHRVAITGLEKVPESAVRNRITWEEGELITPQKVASTRGKLLRLGLFSNVTIDYQPAEDRTADPTIEVSEGLWRELRGGFGFAIDDARAEVHVRGGHTRQGFITPLTTLKLDAVPAYSFTRADVEPGRFGGEASAKLIEDDFLAPLVRGSSEIRYEVIDLEGFTRLGPGSSVSIGRPFFNELLYVSAGWTFDYLTFQDVNDSLEQELEDNQYVGFYDLQLSLDDRDNLLDPKTGYFLLGIVEQSTVAAGSEFTYTKLIGEARGYVSPIDRLVLAARARTGRAFGGEVPITRRIFSGGASSHRGFAQRRLAPFVVDDDGQQVAAGGTRSFLGTLEARLDVFDINESAVGFVTFVDAGDVTRDTVPLGFDNPHLAVGGGLRYNTPVGPLRADIGYRLNRYGEGEPDSGNRLAFHLSLGEAF